MPSGQSLGKAVADFYLFLAFFSAFLQFLSFMWNPLSWVMEGAALVAIALSNGGGRPPDWQDFVGIVLLLLVRPLPCVPLPVARLWLANPIASICSKDQLDHWFR